MTCYYRHLRRGDVVANTPTQKFRHRLTEIDTEKQTAVCAVCGPTHLRSRGKEGQGAKSWRCGKEADERSRLYKRAWRQSKKAVLLAACEICGASEKLCWDHNHTTGDFRGTLCNNCNTAVGMMRDDPELLRKAAEYIETH